MWEDLHRLSYPHEPVLLCWERPPLTGRNWCHRRMIAEFFSSELGHNVQEIGGVGPWRPRVCGMIGQTLLGGLVAETELPHHYPDIPHLDRARQGGPGGAPSSTGTAW